MGEESRQNLDTKFSITKKKARHVGLRAVLLSLTSRVCPSPSITRLLLLSNVRLRAAVAVGGLIALAGDLALFKRDMLSSVV